MGAKSRRCLLWLVWLVVFTLCLLTARTTQAEDWNLGPQAEKGRGEQRLLVAAVKFPDAEPSQSLEQIKRRAVTALGNYMREQSYGRASLKADFKGWILLPDPLSSYKVSPHNFKVDRRRVTKLIEDTMTALEKDVDFSRYDHILIIPGVHTMPGKGYGMICYCANPGMLSGVSKRYRPSYVTVKSKGGREFSGGIFVGAENAHLGMYAHDFFHAVAGIKDGKRLVPCLYDFERQSDASKTPTPEHHAIYIGAWDIMSEHFVKQGEPPPGLTSFTKIRLGWITKEEVRFVKPGSTAVAWLAPLAKGGEVLAVKIPLNDDTYYLIENRQPFGYDKSLPDAGILILKVSPNAEEGYGTVEIMDANPGAHHFTRAAFKLKEGEGGLFVDKKNGIAVVPLWKETGQHGVLVTTPERGTEALSAALSVDSLSGDPGKAAALKESQAAFKRLEFGRALEIVRKAAGP